MRFYLHLFCQAYSSVDIKLQVSIYFMDNYAYVRGQETEKGKYLLITGLEIVLEGWVKEYKRTLYISGFNKLDIQ